jgi:crossover junction endodeoxyribonuclease RusA
MSEITLPWPPKELSPNARTHFHAKARVAKNYREGAFWTAFDCIAPESGPVHLTIEFRPPDKRKRDLDNMLASTKAGLDGIADALKINDERFELTIRRGEPVKSGRVVVRIGR